MTRILITIRAMMMLCGLPQTVCLLPLWAAFHLLRHHPLAAWVIAVFLLSIEPARDASGERLAGPCTALAVLIVLGAGLAALFGGRHEPHR